MRDSKNNAEFLASFDVNANNGAEPGLRARQPDVHRVHLRRRHLRAKPESTRRIGDQHVFGLCR